jgi:hypothetical protein
MDGFHVERKRVRGFDICDPVWVCVPGRYAGIKQHVYVVLG